MSLASHPTVSDSSILTALVRLPISDWEARLIGRRLTSPSPTFVDPNGATVFHSTSNPTSLSPNHSLSSFNSSVPSPILQLPTEIRSHILAKLFEEVKPDDWMSCHRGATPASIIFSCSKLYADGRQMALKACTFRYEGLPEEHRMVGWDCMQTCDYHRER